VVAETSYQYRAGQGRTRCSLKKQRAISQRMNLEMTFNINMDYFGDHS
jgi:hypothetical protein